MTYPSETILFSSYQPDALEQAKEYLAKYKLLPDDVRVGRKGEAVLIITKRVVTI